MLLTYREDANTLQPPDIFVEIISISSLLVSSSDSSVHHILSRPMLEVSPIRNIHRTIMPVQRLINALVCEVVGFELAQVSIRKFSFM